MFNSTNLKEVYEYGNLSARSLKADEKNPFYFSALDGGYRGDYGSWVGIGFEGNWWSIHSNDIDLITFSNRDSPESGGLIYYPKSTVDHTGGSIRCIKN